MRAKHKNPGRLILGLIAAGFGFGMGILFGWLNLPSWLGQVAVVSAIFVVLFSLRYLYKLKPTLLSKEQADRVMRWMQSGELVTILEGLSRRETLRLADMTRKHFGEVVLKTGDTLQKRLGKSETDCKALEDNLSKRWQSSTDRTQSSGQLAKLDNELKFSTLAAGTAQQC